MFPMVLIQNTKPVRSPAILPIAGVIRQGQDFFVKLQDRWFRGLPSKIWEHRPQKRYYRLHVGRNQSMYSIDRFCRPKSVSVDFRGPLRPATTWWCARRSHRTDSYSQLEEGTERNCPALPSSVRRDVQPGPDGLHRRFLKEINHACKNSPFHTQGGRRE